MDHNEFEFFESIKWITNWNKVNVQAEFISPFAWSNDIFYMEKGMNENFPGLHFFLICWIGGKVDFIVVLCRCSVSV